VTAEASTVIRRICISSQVAGVVSLKPKGHYAKLLESMGVRVDSLDVQKTAGIADLQKLAVLVHQARPDLVLLAFGMNDSGGRPAEDFREKIAATIEEIREKRPEAELVFRTKEEVEALLDQCRGLLDSRTTVLLP